MKGFWFVFGNFWKLYVGFVFSCTALLLYPLFLLVLSLPNGKIRSFNYFVFWSRLFQLLCFYRVQTKGANLPDEPFILVANHTSYLDIFLMFAHFPKRPFVFLGKSEILKYPILKTYFKRLNIPVDRSSKAKSAQSFIQAKMALKEGFSLIIFPEGGIPNLPAPKMARFKEGAFRLAEIMKVPIVPVAILNHFELLSDPSNVFSPARPGVSKIVVLPCIRLKDGMDVQEIRKQTHFQIEELLSKRGN